MKRITKLLLTTMLLVLMFGMTSQAAVKSVTISAPTKKANYTVYRSGKNVSKKIKATVKTTSKKDSKKVTYKSSNPDVVSVTAKGKITCKKAGTAKITVTSKANPKKKDTIKIKVVQRATKLTATTNGYEIKNKKTLTVTKGKSVKVKIGAAPAGASNKVTWKTSNKKVATVKNGKITAKKAGKAKITATAKDGSKKKITFTVKVVTGKVTSVAVDKDNVALVVGGKKEDATATVKATVTTTGKKASKAVGWTSANEKVATVKDGVITAVGAGETTVTVTAVDGSKKNATVKVVVTKYEEPKKEEPKKEEPKPDPTPDQVTYTKVLTVKTDAFTEGHTVTGANSIKWDKPQQALDAMNAATKAHEIIAPSKVFSGVNVIVNGENYTLKYDSTNGYTLRAVENPDKDLILELLGGKLVNNAVIGNTVAQGSVDRYLAKLGVGKAAFRGEKYVFGSGTVTVNGKNYRVENAAIVDENIEATVDGAAVKAELSKDGKTITVTSDKSLDSKMEAVEALFGNAYTEQ